MRKKKSRRLHPCACGACVAHPHGQVAHEHRAINRVIVSLDEKARRRFAGLLALQFGRGGVQRVHEMTGLSRVTVRAGREEVKHLDRTPGIRRSGAGQPAVEKNTPRF